MTKDEIRKIVADLLEIEETELCDTIPFKEVGMDSIKFIQFIVEIENKYNIEVYDSDLIPDNFINVDISYKTIKKYFKSENTDEPTVTKLIKCVITDCDGVIWHGISGEDGSDKAYFDEDTKDYADILAELKNRGVLLAIISKNERQNIENMFIQKDFSLNYNDFISVFADCTDKVSAINEILEETGFDSENILYVDDSEYELAVIIDAMPKLKLLCAKNYDMLIKELRVYLEALPVTTEIDRTVQFREQKAREAVHIAVRSAQEYNDILKTAVICRSGEEADIKRIAELSLRTNRFNTSGRRYSEEEVRTVLDREDMAVYIISASDKFGDMGIVGAAVVRNTDDISVIENFMLSCRVFGRDFEEILLKKVIDEQKNHIIGIWNDTGKNGYCRDFFNSFGICSCGIDAIKPEE